MFKKNTYIIIALIIALAGILTSCGNSYNSNMSNKYNNDTKYKKDVDDISKAYDTTSEEVDRKIHAVEKAMKERAKK